MFGGSRRLDHRPIKMSLLPLAMAVLHQAATLDARTSPADRLGSIPFHPRRLVQRMQDRVVALLLAMIRIARPRHPRGGSTRSSSVNVGLNAQTILNVQILMGSGSRSGTAVTVYHGLDLP
jgi:hypothetical protein